MDISSYDLQIIASEASDFLKQLANKQRLMILCHLVDGEKSVSELQNLLGIQQSSLSQHLAKLRNQQIIEPRREAQNMYYSITDQNAFQVIQLLHKMFCTPVSPEKIEDQGLR